jgi:hypothetical protein
MNISYIIKVNFLHSLNAHTCHYMLIIEPIMVEFL